MKNQYFGDINDYRKYGLLRALQPIGTGRLLVAWMLTPDDEGPDGRRRAYLRNPDRWRHHDPTLFDALTRMLQSAPTPNVALIEDSPLLRSTTYHSTVVPDDRQSRRIWSRTLLEAGSGMDLAFVDPDNGIQTPSNPIGRKHSSKYVTWDEVEGLWSTGCSVLIYQHMRRVPGQAFAAGLGSELRQRTGAPLVEAFCTPHVFFLLAAQPRHKLGIRAAIPLIRRRWSGQITPMDLEGTPL